MFETSISPSALRRLNPMAHLTLVASLLTVGACSSAKPTAKEEPVPEAPPSATAPDEDAEKYENTIKWSTASEVNNFGYDVYRSESEDGPFERINVEVIEGAGTTDEPTRYRFVDDTIDPRKTYYYYVESISMSGVRERFTPIAKVAPKIQPEEPDGDDH